MPNPATSKCDTSIKCSSRARTEKRFHICVSIIQRVFQAPYGLGYPPTLFCAKFVPEFDHFQSITNRLWLVGIANNRIEIDLLENIIYPTLYTSLVRE